MRKRNIRKQFWLNIDEEEMLKQKIIKAGITEAEFFRRCITNKKIIEQPTQEVIRFLKELICIANNINQIARLSNTFGYATESDLKYIKTALAEFITNYQNQIYK